MTTWRQPWRGWGALHEARVRRARKRRAIQMEAALLRAQGYTLREIGEFQDGVTHTMAGIRSREGGVYVAAILIRLSEQLR